MSSEPRYDDLVAQIAQRNAQRQEEWRAKARARGGAPSVAETYGGAAAAGYGDGGGAYGAREEEVDELPALRRRRKRREHLIPGTFAARPQRARPQRARAPPAAQLPPPATFRARTHARRRYTTRSPPCAHTLTTLTTHTDWLFVSMPNDTLYTTMCFLWGGEMASCSQVCRELYNVIGETVVSQFLQHFGGRHPRRMMRNVLFRMVEKVRVRSLTNVKGIMLWSAHHGYLRAVRHCMSDDRWHAKLKIRRPSDGATPLFLAAEQNNLPIVRALLARGVEINLGTFEAYSPLHAAANEGHTSVARFLIDAKADLTKTDARGYSPIMLAAGQGHAKIVRLLANAGVRVDVATKIFKSDEDQGGETALHRACEKGHAEMVGLLLEMDKTGLMVNSVTGQGRTPLIVAAEEGQAECVKILIERGSDVHLTTKAGKSALYNACERGHVEIVAQLLEAGADPGQYTCRKKIPLYTAAEQGNLPMVKVLLPYTTKAHLFIETTYGTTPLFIATRSGNSDVKDLLVDFCSRGKKKKKRINASLAKDPTTPRFYSDVDPVGDKEHERRAKERRRVLASHAAATAAANAARARARDEQGGGGGGGGLRSSKDRAAYALEVGGRNPRDNFAPEIEDSTDYLSNPSGHKDHEAMAARGRARREQRQNLLRQEEEKMQAEAARRRASREKAKKRRWLRERDASAREEQRKMLDEENRNKGKGGEGNAGGDSDDIDDGDLSSDVDSDAERRHTVGKKDIDAFVKRQEAAEKRKAERVAAQMEAQRRREAKKWQTVTPSSHGGETGTLVLPPQPPASSSERTPAVGSGSRAAIALARARAALGESPRGREQVLKPKVVSLGL